MKLYKSVTLFTASKIIPTGEVRYSAISAYNDPLEGQVFLRRQKVDKKENKRLGNFTKKDEK